MRLSSDYNTQGVSVNRLASDEELRKKRIAGDVSMVSAFWQPDRVSISAEARAAAETHAAQKAGGVEAKKTDEPEEAQNPLEEFAAYMEKKRSKAQGSNYEEKLKALKEKLKSLESQLSQVVASKKDDSAKNGKIQNLTAEISSVQSQIAELTAQAAKDAQAAEGGNG